MKDSERVRLDGMAAEAIFEAVPDAMVLVEGDGTICRANAQAAKLFGTTIEHLESLQIEELVPELLRARHVEHREAYMESPRTRQMGAGLELMARRLDGSTFPVDIGLSPIDVAGDACIIASIRDMTDRHHAEEELRAANERLAIVSDRERIARDLHDTVIQEIFASGMSLQALVSQIGDDGARDRLESAIARLDGSISRLRNVIFDLRRSVGHGRLAPALHEVIQTARNDLGFLAELEIEGDLRQVPPRIEEHLVPTVREALTNVAKHAAADSVVIKVAIGPEVVLTVVDDGRGIRGDVGRGFGLGNLQDRAATLGGTCELIESPTGGATLVWRVPNRMHPRPARGQTAATTRRRPPRV